VSKRVYSEEEVAKLFQRAAELQVERGRRPSGSDADHGLAFDELLNIAADSGLDPELLRHAALEMDSKRGARTSRTGKSGAESYAEFSFAGRLDDHAIEDIVAELKHRYDSQGGEWYGMPNYGRGRTETIGRSVEWRQTDPMTGNETRVLLQPRPDGTRVRLSKKNVWGMDSSHGKTWAIGLALFGAFFAGPVSGSFLIGFAVMAAMIILLFPLFAVLEKRTVVKREEEFSDLAEMISGHLHLLPPSDHRQAPRLGESRPDISLDVDPLADSQSAGAIRRNRTT
jgi:hypothetical protein